jgi:hypothetical protein
MTESRGLKKKKCDAGRKDKHENRIGADSYKRKHDGRKKAKKGNMMKVRRLRRMR